jgi:hypothetical protein
MSDRLATLRRQPHIIPMSADELLKRLDELATSGCRHLQISDVEVAGTLDFSRRVFRHGLHMERVYFRDFVRMNNCSFHGAAHFVACAFDRSLDLSHTTFDNGLSLEACSFGAEDVNLARIALQLDGVKVSGDLDLVDTRVNGCISARRLTAANIAFTACQVEGAPTRGTSVVDFSNCAVIGNIFFENGPHPTLSSSSPLQQDANAAPNSSGRRSIFQDRGRSRSVTLRNAKAAYLSLSWARFTGDVDLANFECRGLYSRVNRFVRRPDDPAQFDPDGNELSTGFGGARIDGNLTLSGGKFGLIHFDGISVSGAVTLIDGESGQIRVEDGVLTRGPARIIIDSEFGNFFMARWHCRDFVMLHLARCGGARNERGFQGIQIRSSRIDRHLSFWPGAEVAIRLQADLDASPPTAGGWTFLALDQKHALTEIKDEPDLRPLLDRWRREHLVRGSVKIEHCTIGYDVFLTGLNVKNEPEPGSGRIAILHSTVNGSVRFHSPISYLAEPQHDQIGQDHQVLRAIAFYLLIRGILARSKAQSAPADAMPATTSCDGVDMRGLSATNIDLSGLCIRTRKEAGEVRTASVDLSYARIRGKVGTFSRVAAHVIDLARTETNRLLPRPAASAVERLHVDPFPQQVDARQMAARRELLIACFGEEAIDDMKEALSRSRDQVSVEADAAIPGALKLEHAEIDELVISDASFYERSSGGKANECGVVLNYAKINKLYVARGHRRPPVPGTHNGFPVPTSLLNLSVSAWFLESEPDRAMSFAYLDRETTSADPYLDFLDNDPIFRMSSYLGIEKSLRDRGLEDEARRIFIAAKYRDWRTGERLPAHHSAAPIWSREGWKNWSWRSWRPGDGRTKNPYLLRLHRPWREYVATFLCLILTAALTYGVIKLVVGPTRPETFFLAIALLAVFALRNALPVFLDQLYWSVADYGTSTARLFIVIPFLALLSFALVAGERRNFEPTVAAETAEGQKMLVAAREAHSGSAAGSHHGAKWDDHGNPKPEYWPLGERLWMTLRHHVPLVAAVVSEEWQPADKPLLISGLVVTPETPVWWPFSTWLRARDWFAIMLWVNWVLWPLFLPYLIRQLNREK